MYPIVGHALCEYECPRCGEYLTVSRKIDLHPELENHEVTTVWYTCNDCEHNFDLEELE